MSRDTTHAHINNHKPQPQQQQSQTPKPTATTDNCKQPHPTKNRHTHTVDSLASISGRKGGLSCRSRATRTQAASNQQPSSNRHWNAGDKQSATNNMRATTHISCNPKRPHINLNTQTATTSPCTHTKPHTTHARLDLYAPRQTFQQPATKY